MQQHTPEFNTSISETRTNTHRDESPTRFSRSPRTTDREVSPQISNLAIQLDSDSSDPREHFPHSTSDMSAAFELSAHTRITSRSKQTPTITPSKIENTPSAPTCDPEISTSEEPIEQRIKEHLINAVGNNRVRRYFSSSVSLKQINDSSIEIVAGDRFTLDMIERRLGDPIRIAVQFALGTTTPTIQYRVDPSRHQRPSVEPKRPMENTPSTRGYNQGSAPSAQTNTHPLASRIGPRNAHQSKAIPPCPSLEDFIVGSSNRLAFESVKQVLMSPMDSPPVFVHGSCGVGKTHLLRGATKLARSLRPGAKVRYTTGEAFTNSFVNAIRTRSVEEFQKKYRGLDLLCIDDIHLMAGKQATQHHLLEIFNTLSLGGAKIILASDAHPREIGRLDQALSSRFSAGLVVRIEEPDPDLARKLISHIAAKKGVFLDQPAIHTIVERVGTQGASVRDLEGAIVQIQAVARLMDNQNTSSNDPTQSMQGRSGVNPSMMHIRKALNLRTGEDSPTQSTGPIALDTIISRICQEMTVSQSDLKGKGRQKKVVLARELIVHTARNLTSKSFPEIAYSIGRPNHSTVITAAKRFNDRVSDHQVVQVGCPHDGIPASELAQVIAKRVSQR